MSKRQLTERQKLKRDLEEMIALRKLDSGSPEWEAAIKNRVMRNGQLSAADLARRNAAWLAMGSPAYSSPEWKAELKRLKQSEPRKKQRKPPSNTDRNDRNSLYWRCMALTARQATPPTELTGAALDKFETWRREFKLIALPSLNERGQSKEVLAERRRMYRWLWRTFPNLLKACDPELRELIRRAGGIA